MKPISRTTIAVILFIVVCIIIALSIREPPSPAVSPRTEQQPTANPLEPSGKTDSFCLMGCPIGMPKDDVIVTHHILKLSNNPETKFADWVAYKITEETLGKGCKRTWEEDPDLDPETTLRPADYRGIRQALQSDRGHQAPLASLCGSPYWQEADYLSNITPQKSELNEGVWEHLENHERKLVEDGYTETVYSLTGPLYEREMPSLPYAHEEMQVPSGYWKVISIENGTTIEAAAFIMDQDSGREDDYCGKEVSLTALEQRAHLQFFPQFSDKANLDRTSLDHALGCR